MADINTGTPVNFDVGGNVVIYNTAGTTDYSVLRLEPGTLRQKPGLYDHLNIMDKGDLTDLVLALDEKPSTLSFGVRASANGLSGAADLIALLVPAVVAGLRPTFQVDFEIPDAPRSATGVKFTYAECWLPEGWEYQARSGLSVDLLTVNLESSTSDPAIATY